jgi:hypothetical protein
MSLYAIAMPAMFTIDVITQRAIFDRSLPRTAFRAMFLLP